MNLLSLVHHCQITVPIVDFIYFSVVHLLKGDTFFKGSDGANYVPSNMRDVENCLNFMFTRTGRAEPDDDSLQ